LTIGFAVRHNAPYPLEPQGETFLNGERGLRAITGVAIAEPQAQGEPTVTTHPKTQQDLLEFWVAILVIATGRARGPWGSLRVGLQDRGM
jgi:hypothetical protein